MDAERKRRLAVRTIVVTYRAALRHARKSDRERLRRRALEMLEGVDVGDRRQHDAELRRMVDDARRAISAG